MIVDKESLSGDDRREDGLKAPTPNYQPDQSGSGAYVGGAIRLKANLTHQLQHYTRWRPDTGAMTTDALTLYQTMSQRYANPPRNLIGRTLKKGNEVTSLIYYFKEANISEATPSAITSTSNEGLVLSLHRKTNRL